MCYHAFAVAPRLAFRHADFIEVPTHGQHTRALHSRWLADASIGRLLGAIGQRLAFTFSIYSADCSPPRAAKQCYDEPYLILRAILTRRFSAAVIAR